MIGAPMGDFEHGYSNSMAGLSAAPPYRYDKQHLVAFDGDVIARRVGLKFGGHQIAQVGAEPGPAAQLRMRLG